MTDRHTHTQPHLVIPITQTQTPALADPCNNSYNINSFQKQTKPHPEISYGETDNPYNKQTMAFGKQLRQKKMCSRAVWQEYGLIIYLIFKKAIQNVFSALPNLK